MELSLKTSKNHNYIKSNSVITNMPGPHIVISLSVVGCSGEGLFSCFGDQMLSFHFLFKSDFFITVNNITEFDSKNVV